MSVLELGTARKRNPGNEYVAATLEFRKPQAAGKHTLENQINPLSDLVAQPYEPRTIGQKQIPVHRKAVDQIADGESGEKFSRTSDLQSFIGHVNENRRRRPIAPVDVCIDDQFLEHVRRHLRQAAPQNRALSDALAYRFDHALAQRNSLVLGNHHGFRKREYFVRLLRLCQRAKAPPTTVGTGEDTPRPASRGAAAVLGTGIRPGPPKQRTI